MGQPTGQSGQSIMEDLMDHMARMLGAAALSTCFMALPSLAQQSTWKHLTNRSDITKVDPNRTGSHVRASTQTPIVNLGPRCTVTSNSGFTRRECESQKRGSERTS